MNRSFLAFVVVIATWGLLAGAAPQKRPAHGGAKLDCSQCHTCETPTPGNPCLITCPRHEAMEALSPELGPDIVILDELEDLYVAVRFNHRMHASMTKMNGGCEDCHHFTPPNSEHPGCSECHPVDIIHEDLAQPGLKGAYHRQCMGCHVEWDNDTACEVCHEKKAGGALGGTATGICEHSHYEPIEMLELITFPTNYEEGDVVPFHHKNHSTLYEQDCTACHREQSCQRCHTHGQELHPMGELSDVDLHDTCFQCHREQDCSECHGRAADDLFQHSDTGWPLKTYHQGLSCRACHGQRGPFMHLEAECANCHPGGWDEGSFRHAVTGVRLDEVHAEIGCTDCHVDGVGSRSNCEGCHEEGWKYDARRGFSSN